ncbi:Lrp/AsnC family transcriptional regulator [Chelatococcus sp. SYSU_G07232]|uniref:Lrp/AsnC family transcriptional regulator n=1 Tax=Chelatococcus albus TaxID=3047466 RepID=A0ABT7AED3_9HYPH|nr:Lrp/AsnC family transcriptional regulator [Chelatococcus sp. SYSU_G07232]MDJ1157724.1 Lrp/AsnC family transcriptional regulator [Chelatococcus sp. SYSU_G07232]
MPEMKLDRINLRILEELQKNARITNQDLAERVNLSPSACLSRMRRLEEEGLIGRYLAEVAIDRIASTLKAFVEITLENHRQADFRRFDQAIARQPEVVASYKVSGRFDYLLMVVVPDMNRLRQLSDELIEAEIGIAKFVTVPIIEQTKLFDGYPLREMIAGAGG